MGKKSNKSLRSTGQKDYGESREIKNLKKEFGLPYSKGVNHKKFTKVVRDDRPNYADLL